MRTKETIRPTRSIHAIGRRANTLLNVLFAIGALACVLPLLLVVAVSVTPERDLVVNGYRLLPDSISLDAYRLVLGDERKVLNAYGVTIFVTVAGTVLSTLLTTLIAYPISRKSLRYRNVVSFAVFFTMLFHGGLAPTYLIFTQVLRLKDTLFVLMLPHLVNAFNVIVMRTYFAANIDESILESARMDGAGELRTFFRIVLPLSMPGVATIALFTTLLLWNDWFTSMVYINKDALVSVQYLMVRVIRNLQYLQANPELTAAYGDNIAANIPSESARMAMAIIGIGPIVVAYPFFQRYFVKGLTIGAVKG